MRANRPETREEVDKNGASEPATTESLRHIVELPAERLDARDAHRSNQGVSTVQNGSNRTHGGSRLSPRGRVRGRPRATRSGAPGRGSPPRGLQLRRGALAGAGPGAPGAEGQRVRRGHLRALRGRAPPSEPERGLPRRAPCRDARRRSSRNCWRTRSERSSSSSSTRARSGRCVSASLYSLGCPTLAHRLVEHFEMDPSTDKYHVTRRRLRERRCR